MVVSKWLIWWALLGLPAVVLQAIEGPLRDTAMAPDPRDYWFAVQVPDQSLAITIADWCDPLTAMLGMGFVTLPLVYLVWSLSCGLTECRRPPRSKLRAGRRVRWRTKRNWRGTAGRQWNGGKGSPPNRG